MLAFTKTSKIHRGESWEEKSGITMLCSHGGMHESCVACCAEWRWATAQLQMPPQPCLQHRYHHLTIDAECSSCLCHAVSSVAAHIVLDQLLLEVSPTMMASDPMLHYGAYFRDSHPALQASLYERDCHNAEHFHCAYYAERELRDAEKLHQTYDAVLRHTAHATTE